MYKVCYLLFLGLFLGPLAAFSQFNGGDGTGYSSAESPSRIILDLQEADDLQAAIGIGPNPFTDQLTIRNLHSKPAGIEVFDMRGKMLEAFSLDGQEARTFYPADWPGEALMIRASTGGQVYTKMLLRLR